MEKSEKTLPAETIRELFFDPRVKTAVCNVIPKHINPDKLLQVAVTVIRRNYQLMQCTKQSLLSSVLGAAILGLELEPSLGQAYLVPYRNKRGFLECQLIPGYRGYIALAHRSGFVTSVEAHAVFSNDFFEYQLGLEPKLRHIPAEGDRGEFKGAYCIFRHKNSEPTFEYMSKDRIDKIRERSKAKDSGPWVTDYEEMALKTVIRHRAKYEPISIEFAKAKELEERALIGESQSDLLPEIEPTEEPSMESFEELLRQKEEEGKDISRIQEFIDTVAETNRSDAEKVKSEAIKNWDDFWTTYERWLDMHKKDEEMESTAHEEKRKRGRPPKIEEGFKKCPNRSGMKVPETYCNTECKWRQGCPEFE